MKNEFVKKCNLLWILMKDKRNLWDFTNLCQYLYHNYIDLISGIWDIRSDYRLWLYWVLCRLWSNKSLKPQKTYAWYQLLIAIYDTCIMYERWIIMFFSTWPRSNIIPRANSFLIFADNLLKFDNECLWRII